MYVITELPRRIVPINVVTEDARSVTIVEQSPNGKRVHTKLLRQVNGRQVVFDTFDDARGALLARYEADRMNAHIAVVAAIQNIAAVAQLKEPA